MKHPPSKIVDKSTYKIKTVHSYRMRLFVFTSFILVVLMSSAAFSSNLGIGSIKNLLSQNQSANSSDSIVSSILKSSTFLVSQPTLESAVDENPVDDAVMVTSDRTDYNPGETVVITGSGFDPFEDVSLEILREGVQAAAYQVSADQYGNIFNRDFVIGEDDNGASFILTATGATSGEVASSRFTDGTMSYTPVTQTYINAGAIVSSASAQIISFSQTVIGASGNPNTFTVTPSITRQAGVNNSVNYDALPVSYNVSVSPTLLSYCNGGGCPSNTQAWMVNITVPGNAVPVGGSTLRYAVNIKATPNVSGHNAGIGTQVFLEIKAPAPADTTAPTTTLTSGTYVNNAWTNQDVSVNLSAADNSGGVGVQNLTYTVTSPNGIPATTVVSSSPFTASIPVSAEGNTTISYFAKDFANNTESTKFYYVNIDKTKPLITLNDADITLPYGSTFIEPGYTASDNRVPNDLTSNVIVSGSVDTGNIGDYILNYNVSDSAGNQADQKSRTVHVVKDDPNCSITGFNGSYDGNAHGASGSCTGIGGSSDTLSGLDLGEMFTDAPGGTANWTFAGNEKYNPANGSVEITIGKADAIIDVQGYTGTFDGTEHGATGLAKGVNDEDLSAGLNLGNKFTEFPGGTANWTFTGGTNYNDDSGSVEIVIGKSSSTTVLTCPTNETYTGNPIEPCSATVTGAGGLSESVPVIYANNKNAGSATASADYAGGNNHNSSSDNGGFTIDKAESSTAINCPSSKTYTGLAHEPCTVSVTGAGDLNLSPTPTYSNNINAGTATANYSYAGDENHNGSSNSKNFEIDKAPTTITVTFEAGPYVYRGTPFTATAQVTGAGGLSESINVAYSGDCKNVTSADGCSSTATYNESANHLGSNGSGSMTITPKAAVITANDRTKILGESVSFAGTEFTASGLIGGDNVSSVTLNSSGAAAGAGVGLFDILPSAAVGPGVANYSFNYVKGNLQVIYANSGLCMGSPGHQILEPINWNGTSVFKQKSTVPAKFRVCDANGVSVSSPNLVTSFQLIQIVSGTAVAVVTEEVVSTTPDTVFRWSPTDMQWIFNINTKNLSANRTYFYRIRLNDGSWIDFSFGLK